MSSSSSAALSLDNQQLNPPPEQLCYVHCNICDTVLAVSVPCTSLFKTVTVRCGHCTNLLPINMRGLLLPSSANQPHFGHGFFSPASHNFLYIYGVAFLVFLENKKFQFHQNNFTEEEIANPTANFLRNQTATADLSLLARARCNELPSPPIINRPPEKKQRVPSAYNRFIKEEIQRIKAANPEISHREAFSAAAKNWAHFPHIQFGLVPDQTVKKTNNVRQQDAEGVLVKDGYFASANVGVSPY